jgi:capsular polysaccharide biosynthesis protein
LSPAVEPLYHSHPSYRKNTAVAGVVGLVLGIAAVLLWELLDRRVRSEHDMRVGHDIPVLGVMNDRPIRRGELARLTTYRKPAMPPQLTYEGNPS